MTKLIATSAAITSAGVNLLMGGDGYAGGIYACLAYRITYSGTWSVSTSHGTRLSAADISVAWNAGDNRLDIDISGLDNQFTATPLMVVSPVAGASHASTPRYTPEAAMTSATVGYVRWVDIASPATYVTTESSKMGFNVIIIGQIG